MQQQSYRQTYDNIIIILLCMYAYNMHYWCINGSMDFIGFSYKFQQLQQTNLTVTLCNNYDLLTCSQLPIATTY